MLLGYLTKFAAEEAGRARKLGFDCLEVQSTSWFGNAIYADKKQRQQIVDELKSAREREGIRISAVAHYGPALSLQGKELAESFKKAIDLAEACGAGVVTTIAAREDVTKSIADCIPGFKKTYSAVATLAEDKGVKIAFENWPAFGGYPMSGKTLAFTPEAWQLMFDAVPSKALGLEFDPSHLYWQGIDHILALRQFSERVYHVHAKDTEIFYEKRNHVGIYGNGWWTYRIPGLGEINWTKFIAELYKFDYTGGVCIEHEDGRFDPWRKEADAAKFEHGLRLGYACLRPLIG